MHGKPLARACAFRQLELVRLLVEHTPKGANVNLADRFVCETSNRIAGCDAVSYLA